MNEQQAILEALGRIEKLLQTQLDDTTAWTEYVKAREILIDERDRRYEARHKQGLAQNEEIIANNKLWQEQDIAMRQQEIERINSVC